MLPEKVSTDDDSETPAASSLCSDGASSSGEIGLEMSGNGSGSDTTSPADETSLGSGSRLGRKASRLVTDGEMSCGPLGKACGPDDLLSWPLPVPTPSLSDHGILPALWAVFSYYIDEGVGLVMNGAFLLGPTWSGAPALIPTAFPTLDYAGQRWIYAVYVATYAIVQFFVSPPTGRLSDRYGRKPVMMVCMAGFAIATLIQAIVLQLVEGSTSQQASKAAIGVLFFARALRGFSGGITGVVKAVMSDAKHRHDADVDASSGSLQRRSHASFFVYFGFTVGLGRLCGVSLGTYGARDISFAMPIWFLLGVDIFSVIYLASPLFRETKIKIGEASKRKMSLFYPLKFLAWDAWRISGFAVGATLLVMFFFRIAWMLFANFMQLYVPRVLDNPDQALLVIGNTWIFGSIGYLLLEYFVNQPLTKMRVNMAYVVAIEFALQGLLLVFAPLTVHKAQWYGVIVPTIALNAFGTPCVAALVSAASPPAQTGMVLGCASALKSLTYAIAALLTGVTLNVQVLWWVCAGLFFFAATLVVTMILYGLLKDDAEPKSVAKPQAAV